MELCGGTHTRATGEIGLFRIVGESAIAAGVRRIEAVAGLEAYDLANEQLQLIKSIAGKINSPVHELEKKMEVLLAHQKELEKSLKSAIQRNAAQTASWLLTRAHEVNGMPLITQNFPDSDADYLQAIADALKSRFKGVVVFGRRGERRGDFDRIGLGGVHGESSGRQNHPDHRADCRRQGRRQAGQRARRRQGRGETGRGAGEGEELCFELFDADKSIFKLIMGIFQASSSQALQAIAAGGNPGDGIAGRAGGV